MSDELRDAIKRRFIIRPDVKAVQALDGQYRPVVKTPGEKDYEPWTNADVEDHLSGKFTYGHYLLAPNNTCKVLCFDVDLKAEAVQLYRDHEDGEGFFGSPKDAWRDRSSIYRPWLKSRMRLVGEKLARTCFEELEVEVAVSYSGHKGIHIYAFMNKMQAAEVRIAGTLVQEIAAGAEWSNHPQFANLKVWDEFPEFTFEMYPKQDTLNGDSGLGNLVRLPLGKNLKAPKDPTFFVDMTAPLAELRPLADPLWALTDGAKNPWKRQGE